MEEEWKQEEDEEVEDKDEEDGMGLEGGREIRAFGGFGWTLYKA